eukprot:CAMPEP_0196797690 /NCGR_PEP_ID=MMETSP1104-20130614/38766_1 /TAXON_ID=33652 /ORGANISM="Cafeteria sp., Strain Caron Lab Isolate" /LENGTH=611 /DNA_ID=CAMNT_0042168097 /DNA_START=13 /DNA_END=1844 /DNA_ORIENTATION=+
MSAAEEEGPPVIVFEPGSLNLRVGFSTDDRPLIVPHVVAYAVYESPPRPSIQDPEPMPVPGVGGDPAFRLTDRLKADEQVAAFIREANALAGDMEARNEVAIASASKLAAASSTLSGTRHIESVDDSGSGVDVASVVGADGAVRTRLCGWEALRLPPALVESVDPAWHAARTQDAHPTAPPPAAPAAAAGAAPPGAPRYRLHWPLRWAEALFCGSEAPAAASAAALTTTSAQAPASAAALTTPSAPATASAELPGGAPLAAAAAPPVVGGAPAAAGSAEGLGSAVGGGSAGAGEGGDGGDSAAAMSALREAANRIARQHPLRAEARRLRDGLGAVWAHALEEMGVGAAEVAAKSMAAVLVIRDTFTKHHVAAMLDVLTADLGFASVGVLHHSQCAAVAAGCGSACVVDLGHDCVRVTCVDEGTIVPSSSVLLPCGGDLVERAFATLLHASATPPQHNHLVDRSAWSLQALRDALVKGSSLVGGDRDNELLPSASYIIPSTLDRSATHFKFAIPPQALAVPHALRFSASALQAAAAALGTATVQQLPGDSGAWAGNGVGFPDPEACFGEVYEGETTIERARRESASTFSVSRMDPQFGASSYGAEEATAAAA